MNHETWHGKLCELCDDPAAYWLEYLHPDGDLRKTFLCEGCSKAVTFGGFLELILSVIVDFFLGFFRGVGRAIGRAVRFLSDLLKAF